MEVHGLTFTRPLVHPKIKCHIRSIFLTGGLGGPFRVQSAYKAIF